MKHRILPLILALLLPVAASAQTDAPPAATPAPSPAATSSGGIRLNFQNASLADVLNYLSEAAGFIILQDAPVAGTVNVVSKQPVSPEDAIDLLNSVLLEKGYAALRNGRILKIVNRRDAQKQDIPVMTGSDPSQIPRKDGVVTQILPVRYVEAAKLVETLRPLLSADAMLSANEASNSLLLADTQTNIHRIAEIIHALDTSVSSISAIRVFPLKFADSKSLANVLTQLFANDQNSAHNNTPANGRNGGQMLPPWMAAAANRGNNPAASQSAAQMAATRVIAVSDDQSNSVIVSAPEDAMATISDIIGRIDTNIADITETRIFRLDHADATELANILNTLYSDTGTPPSSGNANNARAQRQNVATTAAAAGRSERSLLQTRVVAVSDPRTNSLLVTAARESMSQIALTVGRLDSGTFKKQQVYIHPLENADPDNVATILRGMFASQGSTSNSSSSQPTSSRLNQRSSTGASNDVTGILNTSGISGSR